MKIRRDRTSLSPQRIISVLSDNTYSSPILHKDEPITGSHFCTGCATGVCKNRRIPKSKIHDVSDGNTVSTRGSVVTNSSIDKGDYVDRDEDFSGFDFSDDDDSNDWALVKDV